jgi:hypothetical protein
MQRSLDIRGDVVVVFFPLQACGSSVPPSRMRRLVNKGLRVAVPEAAATLFTLVIGGKVSAAWMIPNLKRLARVAVRMVVEKVFHMTSSREIGSATLTRDHKACRNECAEPMASSIDWMHRRNTKTDNRLPDDLVSKPMLQVRPGGSKGRCTASINLLPYGTQQKGRRKGSIVKR